MAHGQAAGDRVHGQARVGTSARGILAGCPGVALCPLANFAYPGSASEGDTSLGEVREVVARKGRESDAGRTFGVPIALQFEDAYTLPIVMPDLRHAKLREEGKPAKRWARDVDLDDQIRRWVYGQV